MENKKLRLDFIKRVLTDTVYNDEIVKNYFDNNEYPSDQIIQNIISQPVDSKRNFGIDWPERAHTMVGLTRLNNLHDCLDYVRENKIKGDIIETGVWRGGASIFAKVYCNMYNLDKKIFVADSFIGLPPPEHPEDAGDQHHTIDFLRVSLEEVQLNFKLYHALDKNVIFLKGWFSDTLPNNSQINKLSILRMDGDMYKSTMDVFEACYDKVSVGGQIIIDDFCLPMCKKAVEHFRGANNCTEELIAIDDSSVYWIKNK
jgi:O-methyltransferase